MTNDHISRPVGYLWEIAYGCINEVNVLKNTNPCTTRRCYDRATKLLKRMEELKQSCEEKQKCTNECCGILKTAVSKLDDSIVQLRTYIKDFEETNIPV